MPTFKHWDISLKMLGYCLLLKHGWTGTPELTVWPDNIQVGKLPWALHLSPQPARWTHYYVHLALGGLWVNNLSLSNKQIVCFAFGLLQKGIKQESSRENKFRWEKEWKKILICKLETSPLRETRRKGAMERDRRMVAEQSSTWFWGKKSTDVGLLDKRQKAAWGVMLRKPKHCVRPRKILLQKSQTSLPVSLCKDNVLYDQLQVKSVNCHQRQFRQTKCKSEGEVGMNCEKSASNLRWMDVAMCSC